MKYNNFKGVAIPAKAVEGNVTVSDSVSVKGDAKAVTLASQLKQGDAVKLTTVSGEIAVTKATSASDNVIGFVHDNPEYDVDPVQSYTQAQAISAGVLRKCGVETTFTDVRTLTAKSSATIAAGDYLEFDTDGQTIDISSSATEMIALVAPDTENNIVVGIK